MNIIINLLSDLHLEFYPYVYTFDDFIKKVPNLGNKFNKDEANKKMLILAGDIGYPTMDNYWCFIEDCCKIYKYVLCVSGNHEYYNSEENKLTIDQIDEIIYENKNEINNKYNNLYYLQNESIIIEGIKFIGTTLWSRINKRNWKELSLSINDYNCIFIDKESYLTPEKSTNMFENNLEYIMKEIKETDNKQPIIVITHHLPSNNLIHYKYKNYKILNSAFATDLENSILQHPNIIMWCCGHSHLPNEYKLNSTLLVMNPIGYKNENKNNKIKEIEIIDGIVF